MNNKRNNTRQAKTAKTDAASVYAERRQGIDKKIRELQSALAKLDRDQAKNSWNWGFAGDAGHVLNQLTELVECFNGERR